MQDSLFYNYSIGFFYEAGLKSKNISEAAKLFNTTEGNLKWFLYYVNEIKYKEDENKRDERLERIRAFLDGQNERKKRKLDFDIE